MVFYQALNKLISNIPLILHTTKTNKDVPINSEMILPGLENNKN